MAIVQISRIQQRRGRANSGTGLPQLASGELAWSIDTQELYIGNGSVAEGSPAVGNTKILTESDLLVQGNILNLVQHRYKAIDPTIVTGPNANSPIYRSLQNVLDDRVPVSAFGAVGDGITDDTLALQRAIDQLFLNPTTTASAETPDGVATRVQLLLAPGIYVTTSTLYIPSYATLIGSGSEKTFISYSNVSTHTGAVVFALAPDNTMTMPTATISMPTATISMIGAGISGTGLSSGTTIISLVSGVSVTVSDTPSNVVSDEVQYAIVKIGGVFKFINDTSSIGVIDNISNTVANTQPRFIVINGISITTNTSDQPGIVLDAVRNSAFNDLVIKGYWNGTFSEASNGIAMYAKSALVTCENNTFTNIAIEGFSRAVYTKQDILNNSFRKGHVTNVRQGFVLEEGSNSGSVGEQYGPRQTHISDYAFDNIKRQAVYLERGIGNTVSFLTMNNVGNDGGSAGNPIYPQVYVEPANNSVTNVQSDRPDNLAIYNLTNKYVPEVTGQGTYSLPGTRQLDIGQRTSPDLAFRLPMATDASGTPMNSISYTINYVYRSSSNAFTRRGNITVVADATYRVAQLSDEYDIAGADAADILKLAFSVVLLDQVGDPYVGTPGQDPVTVGIYFTNVLAGDSGYLTYSYTATF